MPRQASSFQDFGLPSGASDLFLGRLTEGVSAHRQSYFQFSVAQNFHSIALGTNQSLASQGFRRHCLAGREHIEVLDIHHGKFGGEGAGKSALWQAAMQRHLAAFKPCSTRITTAGLLALVTGP